MSNIYEAHPVEAWEVPVATRKAGALAVGLATDQLGLTGVHARWYRADRPNGGPDDPGDPPGIWLRVTKNPIELTYEAAYQCRRYWLRRHSVLIGQQIDDDAAAWAATFMRRLTQGSISA